MAFSGNPGPGGTPLNTTVTEQFNGTAWTNYPSLATAREQFYGTGTQAAALAIGGYGTAGPATSATEEFTNEIATARLRSWLT